MITPRWTDGNRVTLLENGEQFYPRVFDAIRAARKEVLLETFILADDAVGRDLQRVLIEDGLRGVRIVVTLDGYGSADLGLDFIHQLRSAGVTVLIYAPTRRVLGFRINWLHRLHRKLLVVDCERAFVGGLNYCASHLRAECEESKQDYAVEVRGPVVDEIRALMVRWISNMSSKHLSFEEYRPERVRQATVDGAARSGSSVLFVTRDNRFHRDDIEYQYRLGARMARQQLLIANAYFFPSYRLLREMAHAAGRGVQVRLLVQGQPDLWWVMRVTSVLYDYLLRAGVQIFEYRERPFHGKVALVDQEWATIGSSNLDPLSLSLNLESNLVIRDPVFNQRLRSRLESLLAEKCREVKRQDVAMAGFGRQLITLLVFHVLRHFPSRRVASHAPRMAATTRSHLDDGKGHH